MRASSAREKLSKLKKKIAQSPSKAREQLGKLKNSIKQLPSKARENISKLKDSIKQLPSKAREKIGKLKDSIKQLPSKAREKIGKLKDTVMRTPIRAAQQSTQIPQPSPIPQPRPTQPSPIARSMAIQQSSSAQQSNPSATCLAGDASSVAFQQYIRSCRNNINKNDDAIANNFLSDSIDKYKDIFESYRAQYTDLMITTDNLQSSTQNASSLVGQINNLQMQKRKLIKQIKQYRTEAGASDRMFLEDVYNGVPQKKTAPTLQDVALLLFWFGWLVMGLVLIVIRWMSGGWMGGLFVFVILMLVTLCVFAILNYAA